MDAARHARAKQLFHVVRELPADERAAALGRECAGDDALRAEVESLLGHDRAEEILAERPVLSLSTANETAGGGDPLGLIGVTLDDRYRVEALVSEGGFGFVYRALQVRWGRPVAVKVFKMERGDDALKQAFVKEGALQSELSRHTTAIVQSYDVGTFVDAGGRPRVFIVLEWLEGRTLGEVMACGRRDAAPGWPIERVLEELGPIAGALVVAHGRGIAHRDVKPANIFLVEAGGHRAIKLLDFGVAKVAAEYESGFQSTGGALAAFTLGYAAPEQLSRRHGTTGPWTDVYSLALICAELLAGRRITDADDPVSAASRFADKSPRPTPKALGVSLVAAVEAVFFRALAPDAAERYADAALFWSALEAAARAPPQPSGLWSRVVGGPLEKLARALGRPPR